MMRYIALIFSLILMVNIIPIGSATTFVVNDNSTTIQSVVDNCTDGDTIYVKPGVWTETVTVNQSNIIMKGNNAAIWGIHVYGSNCTIDGFTSMNNGIFTLTGSNNNTINNNTVYGSNGIVTFYNSMENYISKNNVYTTNEGIKVCEGSYNKVVGNLVHNCTIGIELIDSVYNRVNSNKITNNDFGIVITGTSTENAIDANFVKFNNRVGIRLNPIEDGGSSNNDIWNNYFNNYNNVDSSELYTSNKWNTTAYVDDNIAGGKIISGNFWLTPDGKGFSETTGDNDQNGICDSTFVMNENNIDEGPLAVKRSVPIPIPIEDNVTYVCPGNSTTSVVSNTTVVNGTPIVEPEEDDDDDNGGSGGFIIEIPNNTTNDTINVTNNSTIIILPEEVNDANVSENVTNDELPPVVEKPDNFIQDPLKWLIDAIRYSQYWWNVKC